MMAALPRQKVGRRRPKLGPSEPIPDKLYFKIGEVAELVGVQAHVLRYWEKEVPTIRPSKSPSNQRRYRHRDVETFREIRRLLHEERYTLAGARKRLLQSVEDVDPPQPDASAAVGKERLHAVRAGLRELIDLAERYS